MKIDVGHMTQDECAELLPDIIDALPEDVCLPIIAARLTVGQVEQIMEIQDQESAT